MGRRFCKSSPDAVTHERKEEEEHEDKFAEIEVKLMAVFRVEKNRNYTVMSNYHLRDQNCL